LFKFFKCRTHTPSHRLNLQRPRAAAAPAAAAAAETAAAAVFSIRTEFDHYDLSRIK
jgi:hypothetical protein